MYLIDKFLIRVCDVETAGSTRNGNRDDLIDRLVFWCDQRVSLKLAKHIGSDVLKPATDVGGLDKMVRFGSVAWS